MVWLALAGCSARPGPAQDLWWVGVNLAGAEFGEDLLPGGGSAGFGVDYTYPTVAEIEYFHDAGMNSVRLPFRWERLQPAPRAELDPAEVERLDAFVRAATDRGVTVVLDPHNYGRYYGAVIGEDIEVEAFADLWRRVAERYGGDPLVAFGLMNEPHDMTTEGWLDAANAAIAAIRDAGADNLVLVPGNGWSGAFSWRDDWYGTPNSEVMAGVVDPGDHFAYELHQYLDEDSSGTSPACVSARIGSKRVEDVTAWLRAQGALAWLGEVGAASNPTCDAAVDDVLTTLEANADVWMGWAWWAAGPWWGDYMYSIEPVDGADAPQMEVLRGHL